MPAHQVFPVGELEPAASALIEPVSIAIRAIVRARIEAGEKAVVLGAGPIGQAIATAMQRILDNPPRLAAYLRALETYTAQVAVVTPAETRRNNTIAGVISEVSLRTLVGGIVGVALAFLLDYLDPSVRSRREVEELLELPILGEIPRAGRGAAA